MPEFKPITGVLAGGAALVAAAGTAAVDVRSAKKANQEVDVRKTAVKATAAAATAAVVVGGLELASRSGPGSAVVNRIKKIPNMLKGESASQAPAPVRPNAVNAASGGTEPFFLGDSKEPGFLHGIFSKDTPLVFSPNPGSGLGIGGGDLMNLRNLDQLAEAVKSISPGTSTVSPADLSRMTDTLSDYRKTLYNNLKDALGRVTNLGDLARHLGGQLDEASSAVAQQEHVAGLVANRARATIASLTGVAGLS